MLDLKISEMHNSQITQCDAITQRTLDRILKSYSDITTICVNSLFLINGGGVVTLLTYFKLAEFKNTSLKFSLFCFLAGLILTVIHVALDYNICRTYLKNFLSNLNNFNNDHINLRSLLKFDNNFTRNSSNIVLFLAHFSAILFIIGCTLGIYSYLEFCK